jgi:hypothetical protein
VRAERLEIIHKRLLWLLIIAFSVALGADLAGLSISGASSLAGYSLVWRNTGSGDNVFWYMDGVNYRGYAYLNTLADLDWKIVGVGDFNNDGKPDILWRHKTYGLNVVWYMDGVNYLGYAYLNTIADPNWEIVGVGDFNNDGKPDILWRHKTYGLNVVWYVDGVNYLGYVYLNTLADLDWEIVGVGDFNNDGKPDILWRHKTYGLNVVWYMDGANYLGYAYLNTLADLDWKIVGVGDFNNDGKPDILWRHKTYGLNVVWFMDGVNYLGYANLNTLADLDWKIVGVTSLPPTVQAGVILAWDPVNEPTLAGYRIHLGSASRSYDQRFEAGKGTTYTLKGLEVGKTYYAAATTVVTSGAESGFSNEVSFTVTAQMASASGTGTETVAPASTGQTATTTSSGTGTARVAPASTAQTSGTTSSSGTEQGISPTKPLIVAGYGFFTESGGLIELLDLEGIGQLPIYVDWPEYFTANGETRLAVGDLDGDGRDEIVIGFASVPDNPDVSGGRFLVLHHDYSLIGWGRVSWDEYNRTNGETRPAIGDMDGDGKAEIVVGLGPGGQGQCEVFSLQNGQLVHKSWLSLDWQDYNVASGETRPALGDVNGDGRAEVVVGLGQVPDRPGMAGGMFRLFGNDGKPLGWGRTDWSDYNQLNGETWPAVGDTNGDGKSEIILGLGNRGAGRFEIMRYDSAFGTFAHKAWNCLSWSDYNQALGETRPVARSMDDDLAHEILVGLGRGARGMMQLFDDAQTEYTPLASLQLLRPEYNTANGETWPVIFVQQP